MDDETFRDYCAAAAVTGLVARYQGDDDHLRHHYHVLTVEAYRIADEMLEFRRQRRAEQSGAG
ncbi:MAG: hypothetical protein D6727_10405 [Gammaproteobacteria bacterium]|nr:MAG: hypothetical protein D6727_10405 [Gammaproteobacteria bacterium]